ncbi:MAG TPA: hypothetical protein DD723_03230 [Candidatus Omnitrophica bacterium]|nr:MAG: hypothetical protein A2Z81_01045 [Omnitrophica WOR_2 bacterium GWA2_45_18]HBR14542.1 hypothetical protein [Candidatus Omnitrophota bacterium]
MIRRLMKTRFYVPGSRPTGGFTLIELLLGLAIFAIVAVCVYSTFSSGIKLSDKAEQHNEVYQEARMALNLMANDLENMANYNFSNSYKDKAAFIGDQKKITFLRGTQKGLRAISYYLVSSQSEHVHQLLRGGTSTKNVAVTLRSEERANAQYLIREEMDFKEHLADGMEKGTEGEIISANVQEGGLNFSFAYLENEESRNVVWKKEWSHKDIPFGVRIELNFLTPQAKTESLALVRRVLIPHGFLGEQP